ncbi:MAG: ABC transporter substrate-binding protein [Alphaproteobacteria bacterium]|nr:MAG: ABC transporter substrate-binding protein [Alphaproteobacteria bacterium]
MKRRQFLGGLGAAVMGRPFAVRAQQAGQMRHIGVLVGLAPDENGTAAIGFLGAFRDAMQQSGWIEGKNIRIDYRFGGTLADLAKTDASAAELVALEPELIYSQGLPATLALHRKTKTIPIVFTQVADPVGFGLADSLGRPGGNITGFVVWDLSIGSKWMQLLRELVPDLTHVGILYNPDTTAYAPPLVASVKTAAAAVQVIECHTHDDSEIEATLSSLSHEPHGALLVIPEPFTNVHLDHIIAQCARFRLPALNSAISAVERGALISYTFVLDELIRKPVSYIDRILKGSSPSDLPVQAPTKYELIINLKTAKTLGLTIPPTLMALTERVIE